VVNFLPLLSIPRQSEPQIAPRGFGEVAGADSRTQKLSGRGPAAAPVYPVRAGSGSGWI